MISICVINNNYEGYIKNEPLTVRKREDLKGEGSAERFNTLQPYYHTFRVLSQFNWLRARDLFGIPDPFYLNGTSLFIT